MKKVFYFIIFCLLISACSIQKKPIFLKVDEIQVVSVSSSYINLKASAFFENQNDLGGTISTDEINVFLNGTELAKITSKPFKVPARKQFSIPLEVQIPTKKILESNKNDFLGGLLNSVLNKSVKIQFKGNLTYKVLGFSKVYPIDKTQDLKIKL